LTDPTHFDEQPRHPLQRRRATYGAVILVVLALLAVLVHDGPVIAGSGWLLWAIFIGCMLAQLATAALLWGTLPSVPRRSVAVLVAASLCMGTVAATIVLTTTWSGDQPPILRLGRQTGAWVQVLWHALFGLTAVGYALLRRAELLGPPISWNRVYACNAAFAAFTLGGLAAALFAPGLLPPAVSDNGMGGLRAHGMLFGVAVLSFAAAGLVWRLPRLYRIDRAIALAVLAIGLDAVVTAVDTRRLTGTYFLARLLDVCACAFVLVAATQRLFGGYGRLTRAVVILERTQRVAVRQSQRLAAVWRLVRDTHLGEAERFQALLDAGAGAIRPGRGFFGEIGHLDGDDLVLDAVSHAHAKEHRGVVGSRTPPQGTRIPLVETLQYEIAAAGTTISFSDLNDIDHTIRRQRIHSTPWNSLIGTTFAVGPTSYFVAFASTESMSDDQFTEDDHAFVDVLASFLAIQLQQGRQLAQIRYQIEHDQLTDLPSRSSFRMAALKNISLGIPCAVAIVALDRFRAINETYGHMIGDALLVEIAAALRAARESGDVVARLGGDNFAILIDDVRGGIDIEARLRAYRDVFTRPFGTGDRDGKAALRIAASFGIALYPQDATAFDELLARADAAVDEAKRDQRGSIVYFNERLERSIELRRSLHIELSEIPPRP
jgi:diguanylate cyclase (GGDEF)-like protein